MFETVTPEPSNTFCTKELGGGPGIVINCPLEKRQTKLKKVDM
jgi:hypothetical protein